MNFKGDLVGPAVELSYSKGGYLGSSGPDVTHQGAQSTIWDLMEFNWDRWRSRIHGRASVESQNSLS